MHCGISTKQEMELLSCDLTSCYLCQSFTDLQWSRTWIKLWFFWIFDILIRFFLTNLLHISNIQIIKTIEVFDCLIIKVKIVHNRMNNRSECSFMYINSSTGLENGWLIRSPIYQRKSVIPGACRFFLGNTQTHSQFS